MPNFYRIGLHIDDEDVIISHGRTYGFHTLKVCDPDEHWTEKILKEANRIRDLEEGAPK